MSVMQCCGGSVDKVRLPHSYWQPTKPLYENLCGGLWSLGVHLGHQIMWLLIPLASPPLFPCGQMTTQLPLLRISHSVFKFIVILLPLK